MGRAEIAEQVARLSSLIPQLHELQTGHFRNVVIGGGPAGYAVTSTLLDGDSHPTLWIDPAFQAGRLARYLEVPANTRTELLMPYATLPQFGSHAAALEPFEGEDPGTECALQASQQMVVRLTEMMHTKQSDRVTLRRGFVESLDWIHDRWTVNNGGLTADHVFLTTGGDPKEPEGYPDIPVILLDDALIPQRLAGHVTARDTVCVIGSSHSATLVLMNLLGPDDGPKVINLHRSPLKYAWQNASGKTVYDYTGLKGAAARWAREKLESGYFEKQGRLQRINITEQDPKKAMNACTKLISATGFRRSSLPAISVDGIPMQDLEIQHDRLTGAIIPGKLYGFGIAFPEEVVDPEYGHKENSIGMVTFMEYARRVLPAQGLCKPMPPVTSSMEQHKRGSPGSQNASTQLLQDVLSDSAAKSKATRAAG